MLSGGVHGAGWEVSETSAVRELLAPYCADPCLDIGFGGSAITSRAITLDMNRPYCPSLEGHRQILRGDARCLPFICDEAFETVYSSHLVEDFTYAALEKVLTEWRRILRTGGNLVICAPDQQKFLAHCAKTGQALNSAHKEPDFSLRTFAEVLVKTGNWLSLVTAENLGPYSWAIVARKT